MENGLGLATEASLLFVLSTSWLSVAASKNGIMEMDRLYPNK